MFDIGFWELAVLAIIGLVVLGPERLPVVARLVGRWVGRARHYVSAISAELEQEVEADKVRTEIRQIRENVETDTRSAVDPVMRPIDSMYSDEKPSSARADDSRNDDRAATPDRAETGHSETGHSETDEASSGPPADTEHDRKSGATVNER